jgi:hypothetical protein
MRETRVLRVVARTVVAESEDQRRLLAKLRHRPAVHELCMGSRSQSVFELCDEIIVVPLASLGFKSEIEYLATYTAELVSAPVEIAVVQTLISEAQENRPIVALFLPLAIDAPPDELERLAAPRLERARRIFSWISSGEVTAFASVIATADKTFFRPVPPPHADRRMLFGLGGTKKDYQESIGRIAKKLTEDERFAFALSLYHDALRESDQQFRVARMFNVLESLAYDIKSKKHTISKSSAATFGAFRWGDNGSLGRGPEVSLRLH